MSQRWPQLLKNSLAGLCLGLLGSCFDSSSGNGVGCPDGAAGCACFEDGTCGSDLMCQNGFCRAPDCQDGLEGCACLEGGCIGNLVCTDSTCRPAADTSSGTDATSDTATTSATATAGTTSTSDTATTGTPATCQCTWDSQEGFDGYFCANVVEPVSDPSNMYPRDCPADVGSLVGQPCENAEPAIPTQGCCAGGTNYYCSGAKEIAAIECTQAICG